jgi:hypothetical protein
VDFCSSQTLHVQSMIQESVNMSFSYIKQSYLLSVEAFMKNTVLIQINTIYCIKLEGTVLRDFVTMLSFSSDNFFGPLDTPIKGFRMLSNIFGIMFIIFDSMVYSSLRSCFRYRFI